MMKANFKKCILFFGVIFIVLLMISSSTAVSMISNIDSSKDDISLNYVKENDGKICKSNELSSIFKNMKTEKIFNVLSEKIGLNIDDSKKYDFENFFDIFNKDDRPEGYISIIGLILGLLTWPIGIVAGLLITIVGLLIVPIGFIAGFLYGYWTPGYIFYLAGMALVYGLGCAIVYPFWVSMWTYEILWNILFPNVDIMQPPNQ